MSEGQSGSSSASNLPSASIIDTEMPSVSTSSETPSPSTSTEAPATATSSEAPSATTSSPGQIPANFTSNSVPSTSNSSTTKSPDKLEKEKKIDPMKLKILCIHGHKQNGAKFRAKLGAFRKIVDKYAYLTYITAPHAVADTTGGGDQDPRTWWYNTEDNSYSGKCLGGPAYGFEETLQTIKTGMDNLGPFDGLLGFSQGACLVGLLAAMQQKRLLPYRFRFVIIISGYLSGSLVHRGFYEHNIITIPSLHVYGETDSTIPKEMSECLASKFNDPVTFEHPNGHYVPVSGAVKAIYEDFLADMYQQRLIYRQEVERTAE
ncbi:esterase OVCA2 [Spodoptera frugiperda]|uniref:Esterase OVCA2 n=1 Tax=Spodoptera frugiperda TaxID=7108 RepID=A0A9R0D5Q4_SPOFR|nr:esterase OVCA2 [Spodoptera frugiperda]